MLTITPTCRAAYADECGVCVSGVCVSGAPCCVCASVCVLAISGRTAHTRALHAYSCS